MTEHVTGCLLVSGRVTFHCTHTSPLSTRLSWGLGSGPRGEDSDAGRLPLPRAVSDAVTDVGVLAPLRGPALNSFGKVPRAGSRAGLFRGAASICPAASGCSWQRLCWAVSPPHAGGPRCSAAPVSSSPEWPPRWETARGFDSRFPREWRCRAFWPFSRLWRNVCSDPSSISIGFCPCRVVFWISTPCEIYGDAPPFCRSPLGSSSRKVWCSPLFSVLEPVVLLSPPISVSLNHPWLGFASPLSLARSRAFSSIPAARAWLGTPRWVAPLRVQCSPPSPGVRALPSPEASHTLLSSHGGVWNARCPRRNVYAALSPALALLCSFFALHLPSRPATHLPCPHMELSPFSSGTHGFLALAWDALGAVATDPSRPSPSGH